jgi:[amino group carrier protein]-6-phospho-L-2-aminoadipate/5-phospho-L-glutamate reductase
MARYKAAVIGGSGYGANEIIRRLLVHPDVELIRVASIDYVDQPLGAPHPNLEGLSNLRLENIEPEEAARGADVVLLGLPHTVSARYVQRLVAAGVPKIVDLSGDFRLKDIAAY